MVAGIVLIASSFVWLAGVQPGSSYVGSILPPVLVRGLGLALTVTPLTAAVLAAVGGSDLGDASGINDAAARVGAVVAVALVPVLIGIGAGSSLSVALTHGYQPAMIVIGSVCVVAALGTKFFVSGARATAPRLAPPAPDRGCALPVREATSAS